MYGEIASIFKELSTVTLTGISIKMMDDYLDQELDKAQGKETLIQQLGNSTLPYGLLLLMIAMALDPSLAGSLFLSSYIVGMGKDGLHRLPSKLPSYTEMLIGLILGILFWGSPIMISSLIIILTIQLSDDLYDYYLERERSPRNWVQRLGKIEATLLLVILFLASLILDMEKLAMVLAVTPLIISSLEKPQAGREKEKMVAALIILLGLTTFLIGYSLGKKCGKIQGVEEGLLLSPLQIRQESLEKGYCLICGVSPSSEISLSKEEEILS